jgi:hypothetical protein
MPLRGRHGFPFAETDLFVFSRAKVPVCRREPDVGRYHRDQSRYIFRSARPLDYRPIAARFVRRGQLPARMTVQHVESNRRPRIYEAVGFEVRRRLSVVIVVVAIAVMPLPPVVTALMLYHYHTIIPVTRRGLRH